MNHFRYINFNLFSKSLPSLKKRTIQSQPLIQKSEITNTPSTTTNKKTTYDIEEMKWAFKKFDTNKDGKISRQEYKEVLRVLGDNRDLGDNEIAKAFQVSDTDGDGFIDLKEFIEIMGNTVNEGVKNSDIESAFHVYDMDGDGKISAKELMEILKRIGERCSLDMCKRMIRAVDSDGDGLVNIDEFRVMMTRTMKVK